MRVIPLSATRNTKNRGVYSTLVDDCDYEWVSALNWSADIHRTGVYAVRRIKSPDGTSFKSYMHREIYELAHGPIMVGTVIDHREHGDVSGLDNRRTNLRLADNSLNLANQRQRSNTASGYKGVSWCKQRKAWYAYINHHGKRTVLGTFRDVRVAAKSYNDAAVNVFGEFAHLNVIRESVAS